MAHVSANFPQISGIVLNGGLAAAGAGRPGCSTGSGRPLPIIATDLGTHATSTALNSVRGRLTKELDRARSPPRWRCSRSTSTATALLDRLEVARTDGRDTR